MYVNKTLETYLSIVLESMKTIDLIHIYPKGFIESVA